RDRAGRRRNQSGTQAEELDEPTRLERPGATEGHERVVARIEAALDAHLLDGVGLIPRRDLEDALGRALERETELSGEGLDALPREIERQRQLAAEEVRRGASPHALRGGGRGARAPPGGTHGVRVPAPPGAPGPHA